MSQQTKLEKMINTWIRKCHIYSLRNPNDTRQIKSLKNCKRFVLSRLGRNEEEKNSMQFAVISIFKKSKAAIKHKLWRVSNHDKIKALQDKYPQLDIENAYRYLILENKMVLNSSEIQRFEIMLEILLSKLQNSQKE